MDISRSFKELQGNRLQMGLSQEGQWVVQCKVSCQGICSKGGYWLQWDFLSCSRAYIYLDIIGDSYSVWYRVRTDGCQNRISTQWGVFQNVKGCLKIDTKHKPVVKTSKEEHSKLSCEVFNQPKSTKSESIKVEKLGYYLKIVPPNRLWKKVKKNPLRPTPYTHEPHWRLEKV